MDETSHTTPAWNGFVCPDCRLVFRVPAEHEGRGVVCPSCHRMLHLPEEGEKTPPLALPGSRSGTSDEPVKSRKERREEKIFDETFANKSAENPWIVRIIVAGVITVVVILLIGLVLMTRDDEDPPKNNNGSTGPEQGDHSLAAADDDPEHSEDIEEPADQPLSITLVEQDLAPVIDKFLSAKTIDEATQWVLNPERTELRMKNFYSDGYQPAGFRGVTQGGQGEHVMRDNRWARVGVEIGSFSTALIWLAQDPSGEWKVDWESWAGWSEMSWDEIIDKKPTEAIQVRALVSSVDYYNYDFSDESAWTSYALRQTTDGRPIYGYIKRGSPGDTQLGLHENTRNRQFILVIKLPENARASNQVEILKVTNEGWLQANDNL